MSNIFYYSALQTACDVLKDYDETTSGYAYAETAIISYIADLFDTYDSKVRDDIEEMTGRKVTP